jgi:uncharacterized NAD-dependent epimerase/dehydratase family protein
MHGAQPDALIVCHDVSRKKTLLDMPIQPLEKLMSISVELIRHLNPKVEKQLKMSVKCLIPLYLYVTKSNLI